ncbi:MAG TPA: hypothetical protein VNO18_00405 [Xanthobacteraceae bacterium]|jgi:hypothetical protein|nr:hypothetical protein [Xanthobacteraceae bacterium]
MSTDKRLIVVIPLMLALGGAATAVAADLPGLGKPVSEAELALWDMSIGPGGRGQPPSAPYYARCLLYNIGIGRYTGDTSSVEKQ